MRPIHPRRTIHSREAGSDAVALSGNVSRLYAAPVRDLRLGRRGRLGRKTEGASERLGKLQAVTDAALSHFALDELLAELLPRVREALEAATCALLLVDEERDELVGRAASGLEEEIERAVRVPLGHGFAGRVAKGRRVITVPDVDRAELLNPILREKGIKSLIGAPLIVDEQVLGVIHAGTLVPRRFDRDDAERLQLVAQRVAIAIERALVHERLVQLDRMQRGFIAVASHELRTAEAAIYGISATLQHRGDALRPEQLRELLHTLHEQSELLLRLIDQLLDLSRLEAATIRIRPQQIAIRARVEALLAGLAAEGAADVVIEAPENLSGLVDPDAFDRIVLNLLTNALRYGVAPVVVRAEATDRHLRFAVEDRGPGVPDELIPLLMLIRFAPRGGFLLDG